MPSESILETYRWLRANGFMKGKTMQSDEDKVTARGMSDGKDVGSWVINGNTSKERAAEIFKGIEDGDGAVMDDLPSLCLGEWADDPLWEDILSDEGIECDDDTADDLWCTYQDAWSEGMIAEVTRVARLAMPMLVKLSTSDDDDGMVVVYCDDQEQARHDQSISIDGQGSHWECPRDMDVAYASLRNVEDLEKALIDVGYEVDSSEYMAPDAEDLAYWAFRNDAENNGTPVLDRDAWLATRTEVQS